MEACVIAAKCKCKRIYGVRMEKRDNDWVRTWAFPMSEETMRKEKYMTNIKIRGSLHAEDDFQGCPYCHTYGFFVCSDCKKLNCWDGEEKVVCQWCGKAFTARVSKQFDVNAGAM